MRKGKKKIIGNERKQETLSRRCVCVCVGDPLFGSGGLDVPVFRDVRIRPHD